MIIPFSPSLLIVVLGDIIALNILGRTIVVLNSSAVTSELLDKKSAIYSARAHIPLFADKDL